MRSEETMDIASFEIARARARKTHRERGGGFLLFVFSSSLEKKNDRLTRVSLHVLHSFRSRADVKSGDTVLLPEFGGEPVKMGEKEYHLFREDEILGIMPPE